MSGSTPIPTIDLHTLHRLDNYRRLFSITEESIFLQDGILRTIDLIPHPFPIKDRRGFLEEFSAAECSPEDVLRLGLIEDANEFRVRILNLCTHGLTQIKLHESYQAAILKLFWLYKNSRARNNSSNSKVPKEAEFVFGAPGGDIETIPYSEYSRENIADNVRYYESDDDASDIEEDDDRMSTLELAPLDSTNLSSKLSLLLMVPLLKSQAAVDPGVAQTTSTLLLGMLSRFQPMSLLHNIPEPLDTLEDLLCDWIETKGAAFQSTGLSSLIALCCARGLLTSLLKAFNLLQTIQDSNLMFPVGKLLEKLDKLDARRGEACIIKKFNRVTLWPFDDHLNPAECGELGTSSSNPNQSEFEDSDIDEPSLPSTSTGGGISIFGRRRIIHQLEIVRPSLATDGKFLFMTGAKGKGLVKMGIGLHGTLQNWIYQRNKKFNGGFLAFGNDYLVARCQSMDGNISSSPDGDDWYLFAELISTTTLESLGLIYVPSEFELIAPYMTIGFTSDGRFFYLMRVGLPIVPVKENTAPTEVLPVFIDVYEISERKLSNDKGAFFHVATPTRTRFMVGSKSGGASSRVESHNNPSIPTSHWKLHANEVWNTSLGVSLKQLVSSYVFCSGSDFTLVTNTFESEIAKASVGIGAAGALPTTPPAGFNTLISLLHSPVTSLHQRKSNETYGVQIVIDLLVTNNVYLKEEIAEFSLLSYGHQNSQIIPTATYDFYNNLIWTMINDYVYVWKNPGFNPSWRREREFLMASGHLQNQIYPDEINSSQISKIIMTHMGLVASNFMNAKCFGYNIRNPNVNTGDTDIGFLPSRISLIDSLLKEHLQKFDGTELVSLIRILKAMFFQIKGRTLELNIMILELSKTLVNLVHDPWFLQTFQFDSSCGVHLELGKLLTHIHNYLPTTEEKNELFDEFHCATEDLSATSIGFNKLVKEMILTQLRNQLMDYTMVYPEGPEYILPHSRVAELVQESVNLTLASLEKLENCPDFEKLSEELPVLDLTLEYLNSIINYLWRSLSYCLSRLEGITDHLLDFVEHYFKLIISAATSIVQKALQAIHASKFSFKAYRFIEANLNASLVGLIVPKILAFISNEITELQSDQAATIAERFINEFSSFFIVLSHLVDLMNQPSAENESIRGYDWTSLKNYSTIWKNNRYVESSHPVHENVKTKDTITFPNARKLYIKFDSQCSTQYEYDKLVIMAGVPNNRGNNQIVSEFGGNYYGYGGHGGGNWPNSIIGIDGDTMSYTFENRSARERSTPDKAVWGFAFTVFPQYDPVPPIGLRQNETSVEKDNGFTNYPSSVLPELGLVNSITLSTMQLLSTLATRLVNDPENDIERVDIKDVLSAPMFANFKWDEIDQYRIEDIESLKLISSQQIQFLRQKSENLGKPQMSSRMRAVIQPDKLEQLLITGIIHSLTDIRVDEFNRQDSEATALLLQLNHAEQQPTQPGHKRKTLTLTKIFRLCEFIIRQLMGLLEMEWRFKNEIDDILGKTKNMDELFFDDPQFRQDSQSTLELSFLAYVCDLQVDEENSENTYRDIRNIVNAIYLKGAKPEFHRAEDAIKEVYRKALFIATAPKRREPKPLEVALEQFATDILSIRKNIKMLLGFFLVSQPTKSESLDYFYECVLEREKQAELRILALEQIIRILELAIPNTLLLDFISTFLYEVRSGEMNLPCENYNEQIHQLFGKTIKEVVKIVAKNPVLYRSTIAVLCVLPYRKCDEKYLVDCGLLSVVDRLCAVQVLDPKELETDATNRQKVLERFHLNDKASALGWAAFMLLAIQCSRFDDQRQMSLLASQISSNVANHLGRVTKLLTTKQYNSTFLTHLVEDVLELLNCLRSTKLGHEILKQSSCICRLLSLLQEPGLSPRLVLIILKLLHVALPLAEYLDVSELPQTNIPGLKKRLVPGNSSSQASTNTTPHYVVSSLLLGKLADSLICGTQQLMISSFPSSLNCKSENGRKEAKVRGWVLHTSQTSPSLLRLLFEPEHSRLRPTTNVNVGEMETKLERDGKVLVFGFEDPATALEKAERLTRLGFSVSLERSDICPLSESKNTTKMVSDIICRDKNSKLSTNDPNRIFLSGEVAESVAKSIVNLLRFLLSRKLFQEDSAQGLHSSTSSTSTIQSIPSDKDVTSLSETTRSCPWKTAIEESLSFSLKPLAKLCGLCQNTIVGPQVDSYGFNARLAIAALTVLGSFPETIREGLIVYIDNPNDQQETFSKKWTRTPLIGKVVEVRYGTNSAVVEVTPNQKNGLDKRVPNKFLTVPLERLTSKEDEDWTQTPHLSIEAQRQIATCLKSLVVTPALAKNGECLLKKPLVSLNQILLQAGSSGTRVGTSNSSEHSLNPMKILKGKSMTANETKMIFCATTLTRLIAEVKARASHVLSLWLKKQDFLFIFLGSEGKNGSSFSEEAQDILKNLKSVAKGCKPSYRLESIESQVIEMRLLQRDSAKPPRLPSQTDSIVYHWDYKRTYPPVKRCVFYESYTGIKFCGDSSTQGVEKGIMIIGNRKLPAQGFYFEIHLKNEGENVDNDAIPPWAIGVMVNPPQQPRPNASPVWQYPSGSIMMHSNGRIIYYDGTPLLNWKSQKIEGSIRVGDIIGFGVETIPNSDRIAQPRVTRRNISTPRPAALRERQLRITSFANVPARLNPAPTDNSEGRVFITVNGVRQKTTLPLDSVSSNYWPSAHLQKYGVEIVGNFGNKPFVYEEGDKFANLGASSSANPSSSHSLHRPNHPVFSDSGPSIVYLPETFQGMNHQFGNLVVYPFPYVDQSQSQQSFLETEHGTSNDDSEEVSDTSSHNSVDIPNAARFYDADDHLEDDETDDDEEPEDPHNVTPVGNRFRILNTLPPPLTAIAATAVQSSGADQHEVDNQSGQSVLAKTEMIPEYNYNSSMEYHLSPSSSYDFKVFSGPNRNICTCVLRNDECDGESYGTTLINGTEENLDELLVRAWETHVFPTIRRRFRNEAERREGLEQIRGALQLGMIDIARQTVEYLYDDERGSTMPRDLHFPTMEEIIEEKSKFTIQKIHPGAQVGIKNVIINTSDPNAVLPTFAVLSMLRTFGRSGEVLEIDSDNELVLVEVYITSEGLLSRFWYPLSYLEKAKHKPPKVNSMNMFKLHMNLVSLEISLSQIYCRNAFLTIIDAHGQVGNPNPPQQPMSEHAIKFKTAFPIDSETLQLRAQASFREMPTNGDLFSWNLEFASPSLNFLTDPRNPTNAFFSNTETLSEELEKIIESSSHDSEAINNLTNQFISVFEIPTEEFLMSEIQLDKKDRFEIFLPDSAFTILTFRHSNPKNPSTPINKGKPVVHVYGHNGSDFKEYPLGCFPIQPGYLLHNNESSASTNYKDPKYPLPTIMAPTDRVAVVVTDLGLKDHVLKVQGIPEKFPLALFYCQVFLSYSYKNSNKISPQSMVHLISSLCTFMRNVNLLPIVKEWMFLIISEGVNQIQDENLMSNFFTTHGEFIKNIFIELTFLHSKEARVGSGTIFKKEQLSFLGAALSRANILHRASSSGFSNIRGTPFPLDNSSSLVQQAPFSSYLQSLIELCLSFTSISEIYNSVPSPASTSVKGSPESLTPEKIPSPFNIPSPGESKRSSTSNSINRPPDRKRSTQQQQKKITPMTTRRNKTLETIAKKQITPSRARDKPDSDKVMSLFKKAAKLSGPEAIVALIKENPTFLQSEIFGWFHNLMTTCTYLRTFARNDINSETIELIESILPILLAVTYEQTNHTRLFVICGVPDNIHKMPAEASISRGLNVTGGVYGNETWISEEVNDAVIEIRCGAKKEEALDILRRNRTWYPIEDYILYPSVEVYTVNSNLEIGERRADNALSGFLRSKIFSKENKDKLSSKAEEVLSCIFMSCYAVSYKLKPMEDRNSDEALILLDITQLLNKAKENLMYEFIENVKPKNYNTEHYVDEILKRFGEKFSNSEAVDAAEVQENELWLFELEAEPNTTKKNAKSKEASGQLEKSKQLNVPLKLSQSGFIQWCAVMGKDNVYGIWRGLFSTGHDIRLDRTYVSDTTYLARSMINGEWTKEQDAALVAYMDSLAEGLRIPPQKIHPHDIYLDDSQYLNPKYQPLRGIRMELIRARCCILQFLNTNVLANILPFFPLHDGTYFKTSVGALLHDSRHLLFYHTIDEFLNQIIQHSALKETEYIPPDIILDPVQAIGKQIDRSENTSVCKAFSQLQHYSSTLFAVPPSSGSDPPLPVLVKYTGEEVLGAIGSFRHFLATAIDELRSPTLNILIKCPSSDAGKNKDSLILRPGPLSFGEEKILQYFGQLIGISLRTDTPIPLRVLPTTWRALLNSPQEINDQSADLDEADVLTASLLRSFQEVASPELFERMLEDNENPKFEWVSMNRESIVPLCSDGSTLSVSWETRDKFISLLKKLRTKELMSSNRVQMILAGLATVIPLPIIFSVYTSPQLDLRLTGSPVINLNLLKAHTHYQVGISDHDTHILFFWAALESLSAEELRNFIKFATNQERLPTTCPCQNSKSPSQTHVMPFPMKIAPIPLPLNATTEYINKQHIRAETCLFLLRLPPYSSLQVTKEQLLFASNSRDDPLSG